MGSLGLLDMTLDKGSIEHEMTKTALHAAERAAGLSQQLLTFAKGGAPVTETVSLLPLLRETTELALRGSNTKPDFHLSETSCVVEIDKGQIAQVIQNLILNADQAMPEGGLVKVSAASAKVSTQDRLPLEAGEYVKVSIEDQGIGMSTEVIAKIFDPYYTTKPAGHGLGLSISHSIIQQHQGHIAVYSEQNVGTTFEFYLPISLQLVPTVQEPESGVPQGSGRVLLMDDEEIIHTSVGIMLETMGYEVEKVFDGEAAIQAYRAALEMKSPYDLVIMDLTIPGGMGGREAVGKLLALDSRARVLVSSGYANDPVMANYAAYGFVGKIAKPVVVTVLAETMRKVLQERAGN